MTAAPPLPKSKRLSQNQRTEIILTACFLASLAALVYDTENGGTLMVLFGALCTALGVGNNAYQKGETKRPSGTLGGAVAEGVDR